MPTPPLFAAFRAAARGLQAQRVAMQAASENIANATTTWTEEGGPYRVQRTLQFAPNGGATFGGTLRQAQTALARTDARHLTGHTLRRAGGPAELGPETSLIELDTERIEYDPEHPDADFDGYVHYPDVNVVTEMAHLISANRIYEANLSTLTAAKEMLKNTLEI
jgi:flagellar basal-body rod protein FlgC